MPATEAAPTLPSRSGFRLLLAAAAVASLGSLLFGFDTAVISGTTGVLRQVFGLDNNTLGFTVSSALLGTMAGALLAGRPADWWGRRRVLSLLAATFLVAATGCALAWSWASLVGFRVLGGVAVGAASVICPLYISEIAPARHRGVLVAVTQLNIVVGILLAYLSNFVVASVVGTENHDLWRWMFGVMVLPSALFLLTAALVPESPRWLAARGRDREARDVLARFGHELPDRELLSIRNSLGSDPTVRRERLLQRKYLKPLLLACMVAAFNQLDGINAVIYYTADIFRMAGADQASALMQSVIVGAANLVLTLVGMVLIDRVGRKALLLVGSVTFVVSHLLAAYVFRAQAHGWIVMAAMMGVVGSHAYSQGAVMWVVINEVLPNTVRASGASAACFLVWVLCAAVSWSFPVVAGVSGAYAFGFFAAMMVLQFVLVLKFLPETKGVSLEELEAMVSR